LRPFPPANHIPQTGLHQAHGSDPAKVKSAMGEYLQLVDRFHEENEYLMAPEQYETAKEDFEYFIMLIELAEAYRKEV